MSTGHLDSNQQIAPRRTVLGSFCIACSIALGIVALSYGSVGVWDSSNAEVLTPTFYLSSVILLTLTGLWLLGLRPRPVLTFSPFLLALVCWFLSDGVTRTYSWFSGLPIRGEILTLGALGIILLRFTPSLFLAGLIAITVALPISAFLLHVGPELLISDDHASFFYRLLLLKKQLPLIPFYNTDWNGGYDARDFFATGTLNVFPVFAVLSQIFERGVAYNLTAAWVAFILAPLSSYFAARIVVRDQPTSILAAVLAAGSGLIWFRWSLVYGTLGFCTSCALLPLVGALTWRVISNPSALNRKRDILIFCMIWTLFLLWPGSVFLGAPLGLYGVWNFRTLLKNRRFLCAAGVILLINLPWMLLFSKVSQVSSFVSVNKESVDSQATEDKRQALGARGVRGEISVDRSIKALRENAASTNPLIVILLFPGLICLPKSFRIFAAGSILYLITVGTIIAPIKPHLELDRLVLVAAVFAALPSAAALARIISRLREHLSDRSSTFRKILACALFVVPIGMLSTTPFTSASVAANRSILRFFISDEIWRSAVEAFSAVTPKDGRILFSGFLLHELDGGHAAPLPALTGRSAIASSQFHNLWAYRQVFPKSYLEKEDAGITEYLDTMNVGAIFAHERQWRDYFAARPTLYSPEKMFGRFTFFKRKNFTSNYVRSGNALDIEISQSHITLTPMTSEVVLKFNYFAFLESSGCVIKSEKVAPEIELIKLEKCIPGQPITIQAMSPLKRLIS